ncbi:hypothetical protein CONLIGDRAFT_195917 [Coniochaeta ligniaria NRRL 30616]|uniref:Uncharacterized protein n=1 Tax=Coniochaeta ligniaria NRRL 30616 TaxID=1408157 RepID=A0A1J7J384_9PEZI|nr:hypothetical protein CONLIGDRAFT_195917 [Coniochaeta ligniaria NRRL 30616]
MVVQIFSHVSSSTGYQKLWTSRIRGPYSVSRTRMVDPGATAAGVGHVSAGIYPFVGFNRRCGMRVCGFTFGLHHFSITARLGRQADRGRLYVCSTLEALRPERGGQSLHNACGSADTRTYTSYGETRGLTDDLGSWIRMRNMAAKQCSRIREQSYEYLGMIQQTLEKH